MLESPSFSMVPNHISQFGITVTATEFLIMLGQTRMSISNKIDDAPPTLSPISEWTGALSVAPNVAKALLESLNQSIVHYEAHFGKIPSDPNARIEMQP